jgi:hypothetical protein
LWRHSGTPRNSSRYADAGRPQSPDTEQHATQYAEQQGEHTTGSTHHATDVDQNARYPAERHGTAG